MSKVKKKKLTLEVNFYSITELKEVLNYKLAHYINSSLNAGVNVSKNPNLSFNVVYSDDTIGDFDIQTINNKRCLVYKSKANCLNIKKKIA